MCGDGVGWCNEKRKPAGVDPSIDPEPLRTGDTNYVVDVDRLGLTEGVSPEVSEESRCVADEIVVEGIESAVAVDVHDLGGNSGAWCYRDRVISSAPGNAELTGNSAGGQVDGVRATAAGDGQVLADRVRKGDVIGS